ncbi:MAG: bifunctional precorrin-2 dehydrogenase/sirohydrochlorin ferrochelatase [Candidatus Hadarchaeales archaeon]
MYLPLFIDVKGKRALVVGFGKVGHRRAMKLLAAGAKVEAIDKRKIRVADNIRFFQKELLIEKLPSFKKYDIVIVATDDAKLNSAIAKKAMLEGCLVNRVDHFRGGNTIFPAVVRISEITLAFTTFGKNPKLAKMAKEVVKRGIPRN